jgi:hypothetical protein
VRRKLRRLELMTGAERVKPGPNPTPMRPAGAAAAERQLAEQAEHAYRRLVADWKSSRPKVGADATPGRASQGPSKGKAARQASKPQTPAL